MKIVLPRQLREALDPKSDAAKIAHVKGELSRLGGWVPLMPLFPLPVPAPGTGFLPPLRADGAGGQEGVKLERGVNVSSLQANNSHAGEGAESRRAQGAAAGAMIPHDQVLGSGMAVNIPYSALDFQLQALLRDI